MPKKNYILLALKNPKKAVWWLFRKLFGQRLSDEHFVSLMYWVTTGSRLNLKTPETFNEKIIWLNLYDRRPEIPSLVDKYEVKRIVGRMLGEAYIIPQLGVWERFDEIDFSTLPNRFVLKCTHDSGSVVICKDKSLFDMDSARKKLNKSLRQNYYYLAREWQYKAIKPRIIAEKYMEESSDRELMDYKFLCFDGEVKFIFVVFDRYTSLKRNIYTPDWQLINETITFPNAPDRMIERPSKLDEMLEIARALSKGFPHVRIDLYFINGQIYFGECTFSSAAGMGEFSSDSFAKTLGDYIKLPAREHG